MRSVVDSRQIQISLLAAARYFTLTIIESFQSYDDLSEFKCQIPLSIHCILTAW